MLGMGLLACTSPADDATQVRQGVELLAKAIEQHERETIMQRLDDDLRPRAGLLPPDITRMLFVQFRQNKQIQVFLFDLDVNVMSSTADVQLEASIGMAALNSLIKIDEDTCVEMNAVTILEEKGRGSICRCAENHRERNGECAEPVRGHG